MLDIFSVALFLDFGVVSSIFLTRGPVLPG